MPENPEPWQVILLILPIVFLMIIIKYREKKALTPLLEDLTGLQKAWLVVSTLPPELQAGVLACYSAGELSAMVNAASLVPSTPYRLLERVFQELAESLPSETFRLKVGEKTTLESTDFLNGRTVPWFAQALRRKWFPEPAPEPCERPAFEAPHLALLVVELSGKLEAMWLLHGESGLRSARAELHRETGLVMPPLGVLVSPALQEGTLRLTWSGGEGAVKELGGNPASDETWEAFTSLLTGFLKGLGPALLTTEYAGLLLRELGRCRPLLASRLAAGVTVGRVAAHLREELARAGTLKNTVELLEGLVPDGEARKDVPA